MGDRIMTNLDEDLHEEVLRRHRETGRAKSQIVNDMARSDIERATDGGQPVKSFWATLGEALFVVGPVMALFGVMAPGVGVMVFGLGLMLWGSMQQHMQTRNVGAGAALRSTLGL